MTNNIDSLNLINEEKEVLKRLSEYIDFNLIPFNKEKRGVIQIEKRDPMYGGTGVVYMLSLFEKNELVNNRIGMYMILMNKGDQAGFHEHGSRKEQELYIVLNGEGEYVERIGLDKVIRSFTLKKGNVTSIQGNENYHSITNIETEPLIIFVITTNEKE